MKSFFVLFDCVTEKMLQATDQQQINVIKTRKLDRMMTCPMEWMMIADVPLSLSLSVCVITMYSVGNLNIPTMVNGLHLFIHKILMRSKETKLKMGHSISWGESDCRENRPFFRSECERWAARDSFVSGNKIFYFIVINTRWWLYGRKFVSFSPFCLAHDSQWPVINWLHYQRLVCVRVISGWTRTMHWAHLECCTLSNDN